MVKTESVTLGVRITKTMRDKILELLIVNAHVSISDYLRDIIRHDLESKGCFDNERTTTS